MLGGKTDPYNKLGVMAQRSESTTTRDRHGRAVSAGTRVRVLVVRPSVLDRLDELERQRVASMIGETFEVYEVDQWGGAWVEKWWRESDSESTSHSLGLAPDEIEVVT
jgi:hypothetical protein